MERGHHNDCRKWPCQITNTQKWVSSWNTSDLSPYTKRNMAKMCIPPQKDRTKSTSAWPQRTWLNIPQQLWYAPPSYPWKADHRAIFVDLHGSYFFNGKTTSAVEPDTRLFSSDNPIKEGSTSLNSGKYLIKRISKKAWQNKRAKNSDEWKFQWTRWYPWKRNDERRTNSQTKNDKKQLMVSSFIKSRVHDPILEMANQWCHHKDKKCPIVREIKGKSKHWCILHNDHRHEYSQETPQESHNGPKKAPENRKRKKSYIHGQTSGTHRKIIKERQTDYRQKDKTHRKSENSCLPSETIPKKIAKGGIQSI